MITISLLFPSSFHLKEIYKLIKKKKTFCHFSSDTECAAFFLFVVQFADDFLWWLCSISLCLMLCSVLYLFVYGSVGLK
jgi:hypothetical protein